MSDPFVLYSILFFVIGAILGSFGNVCILRIPDGMSVVKPDSHCFNCKAKLPWYDNIPIISCLILRAKCRKCSSYFGYRHMFVELATGLMFVACFWKFGLSFSCLEACYFSFALIVISVIDLDHRIIPDVFSLSGIVIGLIGAAINPERAFLDALLGVLVGGGFLWAIAYFYLIVRKMEGMGGGDIKLLAWIGAVLGLQSIPFVIFVSSIAGSVIGLLMMIKSKEGLKTSLPFGPYLSLAALLYMFFGMDIILWYQSAFFPVLQAS